MISSWDLICVEEGNNSNEDNITGVEARVFFINFLLFILSNDLFDRLARYIGQSVWPALEGIGKFFMIEP